MTRRTLKEGSNSGRTTLYPGKSTSRQVQHTAWVTVSWVNAPRRDAEREREDRTVASTVNSYNDVVFSGGITDSRVSAACISSFHPLRIGSSREIYRQKERSSESRGEVEGRGNVHKMYTFSFLPSGDFFSVSGYVYLINGDLVSR